MIALFSYYRLFFFFLKQILRTNCIYFILSYFIYFTFDFAYVCKLVPVLLTLPGSFCSKLDLKRDHMYFFYHQFLFIFLSAARFYFFYSFRLISSKIFLFQVCIDIFSNVFKAGAHICFSRNRIECVAEL